uniref:Kazal-like domain-containing protein n=1 Tax=Arion vulgaris TaxID=1028688 RepID=A0A0B6ZRI2_9EUPU
MSMVLTSSSSLLGCTMSLILLFISEADNMYNVCPVNNVSYFNGYSDCQKILSCHYTCTLVIMVNVCV